MVPNYGTPELTLTSGRGSTVTDARGRTFVDLLAGIAVSSLGHAHPRITQAIREQAARIHHTSNLYANEPSLQLARTLKDWTGMRSLFVNSGTEANEAAIKLARRRAHDEGREGTILSFHGSFHGRTAGALAATGQPKHRRGFGPLPGVLHVPFNDAHAVEAAFAEHDIAAVLVEPVQGEGGVHPLAKEAARAIQAQCRQHQALLMVDEVQTGIGRTGTMFAHEHYGWKPDVMTLAKALGGGMPIGACLVREPHHEVLGPGTHGCTFGGNPVSAAAANVVLDEVHTQNLPARAAMLGQMAKDNAAGHGLDARGLGLLLGFPVPDPGATKAMLQSKGVLVGTAGDAVRIAPALNVPDEALLAGIDALGRVCIAA